MYLPLYPRIRVLALSLSRDVEDHQLQKNALFGLRTDRETPNESNR